MVVQQDRLAELRAKMGQPANAGRLAELRAKLGAPASKPDFDQWESAGGESLSNEDLTAMNKPSLGQGAMELAKGAGRGALRAAQSVGAQMADLVIAPSDDYQDDPSDPTNSPSETFPLTRGVHEQPADPKALRGDPRFAGSIYGKVGEGLGTSAPILAGGAAGVGVPALVAASGYQSAIPAYYEAKQRGASEPQAMSAMLLNGLVGVGTQALPILDLFGKASAANPMFARQLMAYLMHAGVTGADMQAAAVAQKTLGAAIAEVTGGDFDTYLAQTDLTDVSPAIIGVLTAGAQVSRLKPQPESHAKFALRNAEAQADRQIAAREQEAVQRGAQKTAAFGERERTVREANPELSEALKQQAEVGRQKTEAFYAKQRELMARPQIEGESIPPEASAPEMGTRGLMPDPEIARATREFMSDPDVAAYQATQAGAGLERPHIPSQERVAALNDPDVVRYRVAEAQKSAAAISQNPGGASVRTDSSAAAPPSSVKVVPHAPETRIERAKRAVGNTYAQLERMVRQEFDVTKDSTYLGKEGMEAKDPVLAAYNQRRNESRQHKVREQSFYKPLKQALRRAKVTADEFGKILYARHAPEVNKLMAERNPGSTEALAGMTNETAAQIMADAQAKPNWPQVEAQIARFDEMVKSDVQRRVDAGLITPEQAKSYDEMYSYYAPLKTAQEGNGATGRSGIRGREYKRQLGRESEADNPLISAIVQDQLGTSRIERNKVNVAASKFFANHPDIAKIIPESEFVSPALVEGKVQDTRDIGFLDRPDVVAFKEGGKQYAMKFEKDYQSIAEVLRGEGTFAKFNDAALRAVDAVPFVRHVPKYSGFVKRWVTRDNPLYWPINWVKDTSETLLRQTSERGLGFAIKEQVNAPKMLKELLTNGPIAKRYKEAGGMMPTMGVEDFAKVQQNVEGYLKQGRAGDALASLRERVEHVSDSVENMHRLSVFDMLTKEGMSDSRAALAAAEANVNFGKRGEIAPMMEALFPFYTAGVNGTRALHNITQGKNFARLATTLVAGGVALDQRNRMIAGEDENGENRYDKIREEEKRGNIIWMDDNGSGEYTKIPLVPGVGWLVNVGRNSSAAAWGPSNSEEAGARMVASLIDTLNPLGTSLVNEQTGGATNPASAFSPTFARPALEIGINKDFADRDIVPENRYGQPAKPDRERYKRNTSPTLIEATKLAHESTGADISPAALEHAVRGYLPGLFQELGRGANTIDKAMRGEKVETRDIPLVRRFRGQDNPYFTEQKYYDNKQHALDTGDVARTEVIKKFAKAIDSLPNVPENEEARRELMALANKTLKGLK